MGHRAHPPRRPCRIEPLVEGKPGQPGVVGTGQSAFGRGRLDAVPPLEQPSDDELDLGRGEDCEREPEGNRVLQPGREQPEQDEHQSADAGGGLHAGS